MFLLVFAIFSCDNKPHDVIYTITLNAENSTSKGDEKLYYNATTGLYYSSSQMTTPITRINPPEKVWEIKILGNGNEEIVKEDFTFNGYKDPSSSSKDPNEADMFIGGDGQIDRSKQIKKDSTLVADFGNENSVYVSIGVLRSRVVANASRFIPEGRELKGFLYKNVRYDISSRNDTSHDSGTIQITENGAEIRLIIEIEGGKELTLAKGDATSEGSVGALFYKYEATQDGNNWFSSLGWNNPITRLTGTELPKKEYTIVLRSKNGEKDQTRTTKFTFNGYVYKDVNGVDHRYVYQDGRINTNLLDSDPIKDSKTSDAITATAIFGSQDTIRLPLPQRNGYEFKGWSRREEVDDSERGEFQANQDYVIRYNENPSVTDENNVIVLYAQWESVRPIRLEFIDNSESGEDRPPIHYQRGRGWFQDEACTKPITTISVPSRTSTIQYISGRSDKKSPENTTYKWGFEGYKNSDESIMYVSPNGDIQNVSISSDSIAYAFWTTKNNSINLPLDAESGFVSDENYKFLGWSDDGGETILSSPTYRPKENSSDTIVLSAIWKDLRVYELTLNNMYMDGDVKTDISKLYFKPITTYEYEYNTNEKVYKRVVDVAEGWYRDASCKIPFLGFDSDELPQRVYRVYYNINFPLRDDAEDVKREDVYLWKFGGYGNYINSEGQLLTGSDGKTVRLSNSATAEIKWEKPNSGIILPDLNSIKKDENQTHTGWQYKGNNGTTSGPTYEIGAEYIPGQYRVNLEPTFSNEKQYSLTFKVNNGVSEEGTSEIYYWEKDNSWHQGRSADAPKIETIEIPKKEFSVSFETVETGTVPSSFDPQTSSAPFLGYGDYVDARGKIIAKSISRDVEVPARWGANSAITFPGTPTKNNLKFVSWCEMEEGRVNPISFPYTPHSDITLYAQYENLNTYEFELKDNGATNNNTTKFIYYWMQDKAWHISRTSGAKLSAVNIPEKIYTVSFDVNNSLISPIVPMTSEASFGGYKIDESEDYIIDQRGNIIDGRSVSNDGGSATAQWGDQEGILLPTLTSPGYKFKGWTLPNDNGKGYDVGEEVPTDRIVRDENNIGSPYQPTKNETLYAAWDRANHYPLYLDRENKVNPDDDLGVEYKTDVIYYFEGDGWYMDENGTIKANEIVVPTRKYKVEFEPNLEGVLKPERKEFEFEFNGYGNIIDKNGKVNPSSSINSATTIVAYWVEPGLGQGINLPTPTSPNGYRFVGWSLSQNGETINPSDYHPLSANTILYGVWEDTKPYTLTFDENGATTSGTRSITYQIVGNVGTGWYENAESTSESILRITIPQKEWTVTFDTTGPNGEIIAAQNPQSSTWTFLGYSDGNKQYVDSSGVINQDASISENTTVKASWGNQTPINLSGIIPGGFDSATKKNDNLPLYFNGWALKSDSKRVALPATYYPSASDVEDDNTIKLVAIYTEEQVYDVILEDNGATEKGTIEVYYKPNDKRWHPERDTLTIIDGITIPKKQWQIVFNSNKDGVQNPLTINYTHTFNGYYLGSNEYIDANGNFTSIIPTEDIILNANWSEPSQSSVVLPVLSKPGYEFQGWTVKVSYKDNDKPTTSEKTGNYKPEAVDLEDDNKTINLFGLWKENERYKLDLTDTEATEQIVKEIWYRKGDTWYADENCTVPITSIATPKKEYYVSFETLTTDENIARPTRIPSAWMFNGYGAAGNTYVDFSGNILPGSSLSDNTTATAQWVNRTPVLLPILENTINDEVFVGWCEKNPTSGDFNPDVDTIYAGGSNYTPSNDNGDVTLYAYWISNKVYSLDLYYKNGDGSPNIPNETLYYSVMRNEWYRNRNLTGQAVTSVTKPQKRAEIVFNTKSNLQQASVIKTWIFQGYEDFINFEGKLFPGAKLSSNMSVNAVWKIENDTTLPDLTLQGYKFEGWTEVDDGNILVANPYNPTDDRFEATYNNGVITLYAKWRDDSVKVLELDSNDATTPTASAIYFKQDNEGNDRWYSIGVDPKDKNIITGVEIPKRVVNVEFNVSSQSPRKIEKTPTPYTLRYKFDGFYRVGNDGNPTDSQDIDENGNINENASLSSIESAQSRAKWTNPNSQKSPTGYTYNGYTFKGWSSLSTEGDVSVGPGGDIIVDITGATPGSITGDTTFFDVWELNHVYSLRLDNDGADPLTQGTSNLYYLTGDTWYYNWSGSQGDAPTGGATTITIPKKSFTVTYDYAGGEGPSARTVTTPLTFMGYNDSSNTTQITANGVIVSGYTISNDDVLTAKWGPARAITLPNVTDITKEGYQCVGWAERENETDQDKILTGEVVVGGNTTFYAQWVSTKVFRVTLVSNGATNTSGINRIFLRDSDRRWYKSITEVSPITTITVPQKTFTVSFSHSLQNVNTPQASYLHTFEGYWTTQQDDNSGTRVIDKDGIILSGWTPPADDQGNIQENTLLYAHWTAQAPISLVGINENMTKAAIADEKYFVGWSRYASGTTESILKHSENEGDRGIDDPLGLPIKAREYRPTSANTMLYAILVDTKTYTVMLYPNTGWSANNDLTGTPRTLYYRPSVSYQNPWFEANGTPNDDALTTALQSATETIIANINNASSSSRYALKRWNGSDVEKPTKTATATLHQAWPNENLTGGTRPVFTTNPTQNTGWAVGYVTSSGSGESISYSFTLADGPTRQDYSTTFNLDWVLEGNGYYFYNENATSPSDKYGTQWVDANGTMDREGNIIPNIANYAKDGTDSSGRATHTVTLGAKFTTTSETLNNLGHYNVVFSDELAREGDTSLLTNYPYRFSGWAHGDHSDEDPSSNRDSILSSDSNWQPTSQSFSLYGSWFKQITEEIALKPGDDVTANGTDKIYYEVSAIGGKWYYIITETIGGEVEETQYEIRTSPGVGETVSDSSHIVIPEKKFTTTFATSPLVYNLDIAGAQEPMASKTSDSINAEFLGYLNPDYSSDTTITRQPYQIEKYLINSDGYLTSSSYRKDSSFKEGNSGYRKLDGTDELQAEWISSENGSIALPSITNETSMTQNGYSFVGWSEIYGWDKNGKLYVGNEQPTGGYAAIVTYPWDPRGDFNFPMTFKGGEITSLANAKKEIEALAGKATGATNTDPINVLVKKYLDNADNFTDKAEQMKIANAYYWAGATDTGDSKSYTPTHTTTLYNVWAENYTLAVLAPQNLSTSAITPIFGTSSDAKVETITLSSNTVTFTSSYIAPSSTSYTITYPVAYKNYLNEFAKPSNTGALVYLALFHGDGSEKTLSKTVYFDESSFGTDDSTLMTAFRGSGVSGASGLLFFNRKIATGSEDAAYVVEKKIFDVNGHLIAIGIRVKGYIESTGTYSMNSYEKLIRGGKEMESTKGTYAKIAFEDVVSRVAMSNGGLEAPYPNGSLTNTSSMRENRYIFDLYSSNSTVFTSVDSIEITSKPDITDFGMTVYSSTSSVITLSLNGRFSVEGNYTVKFKVKGKYKENNVEYQFTSHELTLTFAIAPNENTFDFNDKKEEFSNYFTTSGTTITNTTYPFKQGLTYILPEGITAISGMPGGSGNTQNGVFNSDANGETGKYGNYLNNANITRMEIPDSVTTLGVGTFHSRDSASNLEWISLSDNITVIPAQCFTETKIKSLKFPKKLQTIGQSAFYNCGYWLTGDQICGTFPKTLTTIVAGAFGRYAGAPSYLPLFAYDGTIAEWNSNVTIGSGNSNYFRVKCSDGIVTISRAN